MTAVGSVLGALKPSGKVGKGQRALVVEFAVVMLVLILSPVANGGANQTAAKWMKKASATAAVFVVLGFVSATGDVPRRFATGIGGLMAVTVLLNERSVFADIVAAVNSSGIHGPGVIAGSSGTPYSDLHTSSTGSYIGDALSDPTLPLAGAGAVGGGLLGGPVGAGIGGVGGAIVGGIASDSHVSDASGAGLPPLQQKALQSDPLVNFFKSAVPWVEQRATDVGNWVGGLF